MKILVLAPHPFFQNRGTPIAVKMLLQTLSDSGHQLKVLTYPEGEDVVLPHCTIIRLQQLAWVKNVTPGFSWKKIIYDCYLLFSLKKILKTEHFDIIHAVEESAFLAAWLGKKKDIPFVYDMDSSIPLQLIEKKFFLRPLLPLFTFIEKKTIRRAMGVLPVCKSIEDVVKSYDPDVFCQRLEDVSLLPPNLGKELPQRTLLPLESDAINIMYVGNLEKYQGIELLLDSFALASRKEGKARLVIIGGNDKDIDIYTRKTKALGIQKKVLFTGRKPVADLYYYLQQSDILVSPRCKGFNTPMKIYSYLDAERVVLATNMATHTQVLDKDISYLVNPTASEMATGLVELIRNDDLRKGLAANAKARVQEEYTPSAFDRKLKNFYDQLAKKIGQHNQPKTIDT